jgi:Fur family transcriptional regulator, ferric uptake regulator
MIRNTKQREILLGVMKDADRPLSPAEIHQLAIVRYPRLGLRTVYRHIRDMIDNRQLAGIDYPGQPLRYELVDDRGSRPHLICRGCQRVFDLPLEEPAMEYPKLVDFVIEGHEVVYFGYCKDCAQGERKRFK